MYQSYIAFTYHSLRKSGCYFQGAEKGCFFSGLPFVIIYIITSKTFIKKAVDPSA